MAMMSNVEIWNAVIKNRPSFASYAPKGTAELFTERGWTAMKQQNPNFFSDFLGVGIPFVLNLMTVSHVKDNFEEKGFGEYEDVPYGGYIQRMSITSIKPVTPKYVGLTEGASVDPFIVRKPEAKDRFFRFNFNYQSFITIPDEYQQKQIFLSEYGISQLISSIMTGLENGYKTMKFETKIEILDKILNSEDYPLQDTQKVQIALSDTPTEDELVNFLLNIKLTLTNMSIGPETSSFNAYKFSTMQDLNRLKLLVRPGIKDRIEMIVARNSYHTSPLNLPIDVIEVRNFGGLVPYKEQAYTTKLYPVYNSIGTQVGWNESEGQSTVSVELGQEFYKDTNAKTVAMLADKGCVFEMRQNPYTVEPIRNPRGMYVNYWANSPNNAILYDPIFTVVAFQTA